MTHPFLMQSNGWMNPIAIRSAVLLEHHSFCFIILQVKYSQNGVFKAPVVKLSGSGYLAGFNKKIQNVLMLVFTENAGWVVFLSTVKLLL